jgi:hypothetical protein
MDKRITKRHHPADFAAWQNEGCRVWHKEAVAQGPWTVERIAARLTHCTLGQGAFFNFGLHGLQIITDRNYGEQQP